MADGHALIEINTKGEPKLKEVYYYDIRLTCSDVEDDDISEQILAQLPEGVNDVMILAIFRVEYETSYHYEYGYECDGVNIHLESHNIVLNNYKEFYREQLTEITKFNSLNNDDEKYYREEIAEWEEFYDEDFKPFKRKPKMINDVIDLWDAINN